MEDKGARMDFYEVIKKRRSIRKYKDRPVEEPIALTPLGYPAISPEPRWRKPWDEVIKIV